MPPPALRDRIPRGGLLALALVVLSAPLGPVLSRATARPARETDRTLAGLARAAGCRLTEFDAAQPSNPPIAGSVDERILARDGSYVGARPPSARASMHALMHGRVLVQFRGSLPSAQVRALAAFAREDQVRLLVFRNASGMRAPVAATAYLTLMTCERVDARSLTALRAFRDRRRDFGQAF